MTVTRTRWTVGIAITLVAATTMRGGAQVETTQAPRQPAFKYQRGVQPGGAGPNRLVLDEWIVAGGQPFTLANAGSGTGAVAHGGLGDLRLYDRAGREVPFLLIPPERPSANWVGGEISPLLPTKTTSGFELTLPRAMMVDRLLVEGLPQRFLKRATLEGSGDRQHWTVLNSQVTLFDLPDEKLQQLEVSFTPGELRYLRLTWDDRNSGQVPLPSSATAREATPVPEPEPLRVPLGLDRRSSESGRSRYRVTFPAAGLPVTHLEVQSNMPNILRPVRVTEPQLSGDRLLPRELGSGTLRRASRDDLSAGDLRIPIRVPASTSIDVVIEDGNNPPLDVNGIVAVLAPLPWIYFEVPDATPLVARLGDPKLAAPSYDLEAMRANIPKITTAAASWDTAEGMPQPAAPSSYTDADAVPASVAQAGAAIDIGNFRYARPVPQSFGLTVMTLDAAALAHSRFSDLRIVDRDGRQRAYVLEARDEPLAVQLGTPSPGSPPSWMSASAFTQAPRASRTQTTYVLRLPYEGLPASQLELTTQTRVFTRQVTAYVEQQPASVRDRPGARQLVNMTWAHADPNGQPPRLTISLPALQTRELVLVVDEGDNARLPIDAATLFLPGYQVRFIHRDDQPLTLYYGDESVDAPRYDLALLKPYLLGTPAMELEPGPEQERAPAAMAVRMPTWAFWGVLTAAVLVLLLLIVRLLRAEEATPA